MSHLLTAAYGALLHLVNLIKLPIPTILHTTSDNYSTFQVRCIALRMHDPATWQYGEMQRRRLAVLDLVRNSPDGVEDDVLYSLCQWADEACTVAERRSLNCMVSDAIDGMWSLPLVKRLCGLPGTIANPVPLAAAIALGYHRNTNLPTAEYQSARDRTFDLAEYYMDDITRVDANGDCEMAYLMVDTLHKGTHYASVEERWYVHQWLHKHFPVVLQRYMTEGKCRG